MVALVNEIGIPRKDDSYEYNLPGTDGSFKDNYRQEFGGIYMSNLLLGDDDYLTDTSEKLLKAWHKAYESDIPKYDKSKIGANPNDSMELTYSRVKSMFDTLGSINITNDQSLGITFDNFGCKYVDANENLGDFTYRFKMLNPIYNKVGKWWLGDKGQPIMAVPNNIDSLDGEPVVPKSYDDYLTHTEANKKLIDRFYELENNANRDGDSSALFYKTQTPTFDNIVHMVPGMTYYSSMFGDNRKSYRDKTPLEFMSPYNPDVLVPEAKLNELAKDHPEVWDPMIFECNGYKSICVSENGYIISAYQPAPNVFLPIHIYGVSDRRGPHGYDAAKSVIITIHNFKAYTDDQTKLYKLLNYDKINEQIIKDRYNQLIDPESIRH